MGGVTGIEDKGINDDLLDTSALPRFDFYPASAVSGQHGVCCPAPLTVLPHGKTLRTSSNRPAKFQRFTGSVLADLAFRLFGAANKAVIKTVG
jgi:hypothetical protein